MTDDPGKRSIVSEAGAAPLADVPAASLAKPRSAAACGDVSYVASVKLDAAGRVDADLDCVGCGYNLRTCDAQGRCPECGEAVGRSAVGHFLRFRDPAWVQCLAWGMNRFAVALVMVLVFGAGLWSGLGFDNLRGSMVWPIIFGAVVPAVGVGFGVLGLVRATRPEPAQIDRDSWFNPRKLARITLVGLFGMLIVFAAMGYVGRNGYSRVSVSLMELMGLVYVFMWLLIPLCLLLHAANISRLVPQFRLARWTLGIAMSVAASGTVLIAISNNWLGWLDWAAIFYNKLAPSSLYPQSYMSPHAVYTWQPGSSYQRHFGFVSMIEWIWTTTGWVLAISLLAIVPLFFIYWKTLHREAANAKATWAALPWRKGGAEGAGDPTEV